MAKIAQPVKRNDPEYFGKVANLRIDKLEEDGATLDPEVVAEIQEAREEVATNKTLAQTAATNAASSQTAAAGSADNASKFAVRGRSVSPSDTPSTGEDTVWPTVAGTYTNFDGIVISAGDLTSGLIQIRKVAGAWAKYIFAVDSQAGAKIANIETGNAIPRISENIVPSSEMLSSWTLTGVTPTLSSVPGPEGLGFFWQVAEQAVNGEKRLQSANISLSAGDVCTFSVYLKAAGRFKFYINLATASVWGGTAPAAYIDLSTGVLAGQTSSVQASGIDAVGNGIYRVWIRATATTTGITLARVQLRHDTMSGLAYDGDITKFAYVGFPQVSKTSAPINYISSTGGIVQKSFGTYTTPTERTSWNAAATQATTNSTSISALSDQVATKLNLSTTLIPRIQQSSSYNYLAYTSQTGRRDNQMWFFAKSVKRITHAGVFIFKKASDGTIAADVRVQVLHQRGATTTILTDQTLPFASLSAYDDAESVTDFRNYEVNVPLTNPVTLASGDLIFVSVSCNSGLNPVYADTNKDQDSGEWNNGPGQYFRRWTTTLPSTFTTIPDYTVRLDSNPGIVHFYESSTDYQRIANIENILGGTTLPAAPVIETLIPSRIFGIWSDIPGYEPRAASLYLDNIIKLTDRTKNNIRFTNNSDRLPIIPIAPSSGNKATESISVTTKQGDWAAVNATVTSISTKATVLASQFPKVLLIGDSQTVGQNANFDNSGTEDVYWLQMLEEFKKMNVRAASGYNAKMLGSRVNYSKSFTYNGATQNIQGCAEAISGTSLLSWLKHTVANGTMRDGGQGPWDLLGLGNGTGTDWTGSTAQRAQYVAVCEGQNPPILTGALYTYLGLGTPSSVSNTINSTEQAAITAACQNRLNNPQNWFFDKDKSGNTRFSLAKFLSRKKTLADDGVTRLVVGSTAGSLVTDVNAFDVCTPTHVVFRFMENEWNPFRPTNASIVGTLFQQAIDAVHAEYPNIHVAVAPIGDVSTFFPELYPNVKVPLRVGSSWKYDFLKNIKSTIVESDITKSYFIPLYAIQPTAFGWNMLRVGDEMTDKPLQDYSRSYYWTTFDGDIYHPGGFAHAAWAQQFLSWIAYTYT
jgi:hypothetical protein